MTTLKVRVILTKDGTVIFDKDVNLSDGNMATLKEPLLMACTVLKNQLVVEIDKLT